VSSPVMSLPSTAGRAGGDMAFSFGVISLIFVLGVGAGFYNGRLSRLNACSTISAFYLFLALKTFRKRYW